MRRARNLYAILRYYTIKITVEIKAKKVSNGNQPKNTSNGDTNQSYKQKKKNNTERKNA